MEAIPPNELTPIELLEIVGNPVIRFNYSCRHSKCTPAATSEVHEMGILCHKCSEKELCN